MKNEIIVVNKEKNYTSRDIVNQICKIKNTKKVGHTGTLDPIATGVLVVVTNKATKLVELLTALDKEYIAKAKLGITTDTLDITGNIIDQKSINVSYDDVKNCLESFLGDYEQVVPKYSAIKVKGKKLYEYARNNEDVILPHKKGFIFDIKLLSFENDIVNFKVKVSKGMYIRSLINDIGIKLNTGATMTDLCRIKQGKFKIEDSFTINDIKNNNYQALSIKDVFDFEHYILTDHEYEQVKNGNRLKYSLRNDYIMLLYQEKEIAIYQKDKEFIKPYKMFI